jgi:hypothetical protein
MHASDVEHDGSADDNDERQDIHEFAFDSEDNSDFGISSSDEE